MPKPAQLQSPPKRGQRRAPEALGTILIHDSTFCGRGYRVSTRGLQVRPEQPLQLPPTAWFTRVCAHVRLVYNTYIAP